MMKENKKLNKIPDPKTIARRFAKGKYMDYPADIVMSAVNSHDYEYNSITIPIQVPFKQLLAANFEAFVYLYENISEELISEFLANPNEFFSDRGIDIPVPFDEKSAKIFSSLLEDDIRGYYKSRDGLEKLIKLGVSKADNWFTRHTERYSYWFMNAIPLVALNIPSSIEDEILEKYGFDSSFETMIHWICRHLSEKNLK